MIHVWQHYRATGRPHVYMGSFSDLESIPNELCDDDYTYVDEQRIPPGTAHDEGTYVDTRGYLQFVAGAR
jgi:hypothetical protein